MSSNPSPVQADTAACFPSENDKAPLDAEEQKVQDVAKEALPKQEPAATQTPKASLPTENVAWTTSFSFRLARIFSGETLENFLYEAIENGDVDRVRLCLEKLDVTDLSSKPIEDCEGRSLLHIAAAFGHKELVKMFLNMNAVVDERDNDDWTPLHEAAFHGYEEIVVLLLNAGAKIHIKGQSAWTPLHAASFSNCGKIIQILCEKDPSILNSTDTAGQTALFVAALQNREEATRALLAANASPFIQDHKGNTPAHIAAASGNKEALQALLEIEVEECARLVNQTNQEGKTPLHCAALFARKELIEILLEGKASVDAQDKDGQTPLHITAFYNHKETGQALLARGASVDAQDKDGQTPLHIAAFCNHEEMITLLAAEKACIDQKNQDGKTPLDIALSCGNVEATKALLEAKAPFTLPNEEGYLPFHVVACQDQADLLEVFLQKKPVAIDLVDANGSTMLHIAIRFGAKKAARCLLRHGASVSKLDQSGQSAMHLAIISGFLDLLDLFLGSAPNDFVNMKNSEGKTLLHIAVEIGNMCVFKSLVAKGALLDAQDACGQTPMHWAVKKGNIYLFKELLKQGARADLKDHNGQTPLDLAKKREDGHIFSKYLQQEEACLAQEPAVQEEEKEVTQPETVDALSVEDIAEEKTVA